MHLRYSIKLLQKNNLLNKHLGNEQFWAKLTPRTILTNFNWTRESNFMKSSRRNREDETVRDVIQEAFVENR